VLEVERYTSPSRLEAEKRVLFRRCPIIVGRETELASAGRFFTHDASGLPLLLARDADGLHAMLNVCRHRSARLVFDEEGSAESFVCRYHSWRYDLAGRLHRPGRVSLPAAAQQFVDDCALSSFPCAVRHGFVWVLAMPRASLDVPAALGELDGVMGAIDLASHVVVSRTTETRATNWKRVVEEHLPSASLVFPSSLFTFEGGSVSHLAVFPSAVDESTLVHTTLAPARGAPPEAAQATPRTDAGAFHAAIDRTIAAHPVRE
jgi:phenylpropionate dioxygenase-like ring-hydroxylating dioxygenase large terminal subunit